MSENTKDDVSNAGPDKSESKLDDAQSTNHLTSNNQQESIPGTNATLPKNDVNDKNTSEARKMGGFPGDVSNIKPIFSLKSKNSQAKERFSQKSQEYLDSHKMSIYL